MSSPADQHNAFAAAVSASMFALITACVLAIDISAKPLFEATYFAVTLSMYTMIPAFYRSLLKSAVSGTDHRVHTTKEAIIHNNFGGY